MGVEEEKQIPSPLDSLRYGMTPSLFSRNDSPLMAKALH
jgi:hypothetical protein